MAIADLYSAIFKRKSVRKFDMTPLDDTCLQELKQFIDTLTPVLPEISYTIGTPEDHRRNMIPMKAPHYLSFYSEKKEGYLLNIGYIVEQIILYLTSKGIGTCWLGLAKPIEDGLVGQTDQQFVIMLAFGKGVAPIFRSGAQDFKRKSISEISSVENGESLLEPVRLAPSGINRQPWFFTGNENKIHVFREKLGFVKSPMYGKTDQIDMGVALCHLEISADHYDKKWVYDWSGKEKLEGYIHVCTLSLENDI